MKLVVKPRFRDLIPPLSEAELSQLESNLKADGCREPLALWDGVIVDGHNRYDLCRKHGIKFNTVAMDFADEDAAAFWIINNQFGRRNLTPFARGELALKAEELIAKKAKANQKAGGGDKKSAKAKSGSQNSVNPIARVDAQKELAKLAHVSHDTIAKVKLITANADEETKKKLRSNSSGLTIHKVAKAIKSAKAQDEKKQKREQAAKEAANTLPIDEDQGVQHADFRELCKDIADESVDLIFTDPPYHREYLPLFGDMAREAARILKPGASLVTYLGAFQLPEVMELVRPHLRFWWPLCCLHTGSSARMTEYGVVVKWKPMLWFVKGTRGDKTTMIEDVIVSAREKCTHEWQQGTTEATYCIEFLTAPGGFVFDPFCGGGTTAVAAKMARRKWLTCDTDEASVSLARKRIHETVAG
jgi:16S rRNA G966 N2-methylase RsmD